MYLSTHVYVYGGTEMKAAVPNAISELKKKKKSGASTIMENVCLKKEKAESRGLRMKI